MTDPSPPVRRDDSTPSRRRPSAWLAGILCGTVTRVTDAALVAVWIAGRHAGRVTALQPAAAGR